MMVARVSQLVPSLPSLVKKATISLLPASWQSRLLHRLNPKKRKLTFLSLKQCLLQNLSQYYQLPVKRPRKIFQSVTVFLPPLSPKKLHWSKVFLSPK